MENIIEKALKIAQRLGAKDVEIFLEEYHVKKYSWKHCFENFQTANFFGASIRVLVNGKHGFFSFTGTSPKLFERGVKLAVKIARVSRREPYLEEFPEYGKSKVEDIFDKKIKETGIQEMKNIVEKLKNESEAELLRGSLKAVSYATALFNFSDSISEERTYISLNTSIKKRESKPLQRYICFRTLKRFLEEFETLKNYAEEIKHFSSPSQLPTGKYNVLLLPNIAGELMKRMLVNMLCADRIQKGKSPWEDVGKQIACKELSIIDSGIIPCAFGSKSFDGDGLPTKEKILVQNGVLKNYIYDYYRALIDCTESTGNATRSYKKLPKPAPSNVIIEEGDYEPEGEYVIVHRIIGEKLSNPLRGELSFQISAGFLKKQNGELLPVTGAIVHDNFFDLIKHRMKICKGQEWCKNVCSPPILLENVCIAGK